MAYERGDRESGRRGHSPRPVRKEFGRRSTDLNPKTTVSQKALVITVLLADALYLAGEALLASGNFC
jgi:hypothetical protein